MAVATVEDAVAALEKAVTALEPALYEEGDAARLLDLFVRGKRLCEAAQSLLAARVDDPMALARQAGTSLGRARDVIETGKRLRRAVGTGDAFRRGELSFEQAS